MANCSECDRLKGLLRDAANAKHMLVTGQHLAVVVDQNLERVEFSRANLPELNKYILQLQGDVAKACTGGLGVNPQRQYGPAGVTF